MFGNLISSVIKIGSLPIDAANSAADMICGGDGSKTSRLQNPTPLSFLEELRDNIANSAEEIDDE